MKNLYTEKFYEGNIPNSLKSAHIILPCILKLFKINTLIDFGCGRGTWLKAADDLGVKNLVGLDGHWNKNKMLSNHVLFYELKNHKSLRKQSYDLCISLEVFEHIEMALCDELIDTMTSVSNIILFSAAFTKQRGTDHKNERLPSFWASRFIKKGFFPYDVIRPTFWGNTAVEYCYQQNTFLYINKKIEKSIPAAVLSRKMENISFMDAMSPGIYLNRSGRDTFKDLFDNLARLLKQKIGK